MVAAVVLDVEVAVSRLCKCDLREPALGLLSLVAEFVRRVDADAADEPEGDCQADALGDAQPTACDDPAAEDKAGILERKVEVGHPAVVAITLEGGDGIIGRSGEVASGDEVNDRDGAEDEERADPQPGTPIGDGMHPDADEGKAWHDEADGPQRLLRVPPRPLPHAATIRGARNVRKSGMSRRRDRMRAPGHSAREMQDATVMPHSSHDRGRLPGPTQ